RVYIVRDKKSLRATEAGKALIDLIKVELVKSPRLTGIWENRLRMIERGSYQASEFAAQIKQMVNEIVLDVLADNQYTKIYSEQVEPEAAKPKAKKRGKSDKGGTPAKPRRKAIRKLEEIVCPACGQGHIIKGRTAYGCSRYREGCKVLLPFDKYDSELTPAKLYAKMKPLYGKD
ncbi:MAG: DNA topoisomerase III, partial [Paramuribaculum sp.]|nr:DNA topoisomerase III [Paramuribaculum sp.]